MFKVVTMSDKAYFDCGKLFLETRDKINADFVLYGPDLNDKQVDILKKKDIEYVMVEKMLFETRMQFLKFSSLIEQITIDPQETYNGFTFVDFDTFFINDWSHVFDYDFDYGITVRNDMVGKKCLRAYANGGVVFVKHSAYDLLMFARHTILNGQDSGLPEYDRIWKTLENGRPKHKTHYRTELRWWVDQVFLSSLVLRYFEEYGYCKIEKMPKTFPFNRIKIGLFGCDYYNLLDSKPKITDEKNVYIRHLKSTGRKSMGMKKIVEKLER